MKKLLDRFKVACLLLLLGTPALGQQQQNVRQGGSVTFGHPAYWVAPGILQDAGTAVSGLLTGLGVTQGNGPGICVKSGTAPAAYNRMCLTTSLTGGGVLTLDNIGGGASGGFTAVINGTSYPFPFAGTVGLTVGTSTIASGVTNQLLYDNAGVLGEITKANNAVMITNGSGVPSFGGTLSGNTTKFGTTSGALTSGNCIKSDASGNLIDAGAACSSAASLTVGSTVINSGTTTRILYDAAGVLGENASLTFTSGSSTLTTGSLALASAGTLTWSNDAIFLRDGANTIAQRNSTVAQNFKVYNTFTNATNYERGTFDWTSLNVLSIGTEKGATGTARNVQFVRGGTVAGTITSQGLNLSGTSSVTLATNTALGTLFTDKIGMDFANVDITLVRDAAGILAQRNSTTNPQAYRVYNTFTDASNYERGTLDWVQAANVFVVGTEKAGSGTARDIRFVRGGTTVGSLTAQGFAAQGTSSVTLATNGALGTIFVDKIGMDFANVDIVMTRPGANQFQIAVSTVKKFDYGVTVAGAWNFASHVGTTGTAPALTSCGTGSPAISAASTDTAGEVTEGTTVAGCVVSFNVAYAVAPVCVLAPKSAIVAAFSWTVSTTAITVTNTNGSGLVFTYICSGK